MTTTTDSAAARWFASVTVAIHDALPQSIRRILPATFIGYVFINGSGFLLDMGILTLLMPLRHQYGIRYPVLFSIGYGLASIYSFLLNRWLNFREHGDLGKQTWRYVATILSNYLIWIVGFGAIQDALGVQIQLARFISACLEGLYVYLMMRFFVFPKHRGTATDVTSPQDATLASPSANLDAQPE